MHLGLEAIDFQKGESNLAKGLTEIYQDMVDYANSITPDSIAEKKLMVLDKFEEVATPRFKKLIFDEINLVVDEVHYMSEKLSGLFAVRMKMGHDVIDKVVGNYTGQHVEAPKYRPKTYAELVKISDSLDKTNNKFKRVNVKDDKYRVGCDLYIDIVAATMVRDVLHTKFEPLTAKELAAIELHEIGHMMTLIEHAADLYYTRNEMDKSMDYFIKYASIDEKMKTIEAIKAGVKDHPELKKTLPVLNQVEEFHKKIKDNSGMGETILKRLLMILGVMVNICLFIFLRLVQTFRTFQIGRIIFTSIGFWIETVLKTIPKVFNAGDKSSDFRVTEENNMYMERLADEYVTRHGYGSYLTGALRKLVSYMEYGGLISKETHNHYNRSSTLMFFIMQLPFFVYKVMGGVWNDPFQKYEDEFDRMKRIRQDMMPFFKKVNADRKTMEYYLKEMQQIETEYNKKSKTVNGRIKYIAKVFWNFRENHFSPKTIIGFIVDGKFDIEYRPLMNKVENLINNELYHKSSILEYHGSQMR